MNEPDPEVRYGAFNALRARWTGPTRSSARCGCSRDEAGPGARPGRRGDGRPDRAELGRSARKYTKRDDLFSLYQVDCDGPPMVHVSRSRRTEVVVFGARPEAADAGRDRRGTGRSCWNAEDGDAKVQISRIEPGRVDAVDSKVASDLDLGVGHPRAGEPGGDFRTPEVLTILKAAGAASGTSPAPWSSTPYPPRRTGTTRPSSPGPTNL